MNHITLKAGVQCAFSAGWACLWSFKRTKRKTFPHFFHLLPNSCQTHNGLISSRPSWRQRAGFGLFRTCGFIQGYANIESRKKQFVLMLIPFLCVIHLWPISLSEAGLKVEAWCVSWCLFYLPCQTTMRWEEQGVHSVLTRLILLTAFCCFYALVHRGLIDSLIIESYHLPQSLCLIYLRVKCNLCHTAPFILAHQID